MLFGVGLGVIGVNRALEGEEPIRQAVQTPIRAIAESVPADATHTHRIGQRRIVRTSDGRLVVLYPGPDGLQIVSDQANQGRTWRSPVTLPPISAQSFSVEADTDDRLHVGFSDGASISYTVLTQNATGWNAANVVALDDSAPGSAVAIAWDQARGVAHVAWVSGDGAPTWAAVSGETPEVVATESLSAPAEGESSLMTIASDRQAGVVVAYSRGPNSDEWFSRALGDDPASGELEWGPEERIPVDHAAKAATLAIDERARAHLVLASSDGTALSYFRRSTRTGWTSPQAILTPGTTDVDYPSVTLDASSRLVYVFFHTRGDASGVHLAVHDPATEWEIPYRVGSPEDVPEGALYPTAIEETTGQPIVLWTTTADPHAIQSARVTAP